MMTMTLKHFFLVIALLTSCLSIQAQGKFDPAKFKADRQKYITEEAGLTQQEAAKFFPLYDEMSDKLRAIHQQKKALRKSKPTTEAAYRKVIEQRDAFEVRMKEIERTYHVKFLNVLSAKKLYDVLNAETRFYKNAFKKTAKK
jgi:hypothetical protein